MPELEHWIARQEIHDVLVRYCRGLDRMDREMARAVWHEDGTADYVGIYQGTGRGFVDWVWQAHAAMERHSHQIHNVLVEVDGEQAVSEASVSVLLWRPPAADGRRLQISVRGRYLDRWSRRTGRWAIDHRVHVVDMQSTAALEGGSSSPNATRDERDASRALFR